MAKIAEILENFILKQENSFIKQNVGTS